MLVHNSCQHQLMNNNCLKIFVEIHFKSRYKCVCSSLVISSLYKVSMPPTCDKSVKGYLFKNGRKSQFIQCFSSLKQTDIFIGLPIRNFITVSFVLLLHSKKNEVTGLQCYVDYRYTAL